MTRRNLIQKCFGALAAVSCFGFIRDKSSRVQHKAINTDDFCLYDLSLNPDELMVKITDQINERIKVLIDDCKKDGGEPLETIEIHYQNVLHQVHNPDGKIAFFRVYGSRGHDLNLEGFVLPSGDQWKAIT